MRISSILPIFLLFFSQIAIAQKQKNIFPIWTYHQKNVNIYGVSLGIGTLMKSPKNTNTTGIKIEIPGIGLFMPLIPTSLVAENETAFQLLKKEPISEHINGLAISASGTACDCITNGISVGFVGQYNFKVNGVSGAVFMNMLQINNGIQLAFASNDAYKSNGIQIGYGNFADKKRGVQIGIFNASKSHSGVQIGAINRSRKLRGVQIGIWNVNQRRKMPFINWNFKK
jgi:hypothetical protein